MENYQEPKRKLSRREKGKIYEIIVKRLLERSGYIAEIVGNGNDFGVDLIATANDGRKIAVQCKSLKGNCGVYAVQEVYSGGRYYDISHFAVVSINGFTANAIKMARVLGVYLCDGTTFDYPENIKNYCKNVLENYPCKFEKFQYEFGDGKKKLQSLCEEYKISPPTVMKRLRQGMTIEEAVKQKKWRRKQYTVDGFSGNLREVAAKYEINPETVRYRMLYRGMTIEEAVKAPLESQGRPRK